MVILGSWGDRPLTVSMKPNCLTISLEGDGGAEVFSYDLTGRPWTALLDGVSYRRGLDGKMVAKWHTPEREPQRRWLPPPEARQVEARLRTRLAGLENALQDGAAVLRAELPPQARAAMARALAFDEAASLQDSARYLQVYRPVGILPPDQYMAVVLQLTEGCAFNTCTFCDFYRDRPFRIKDPTSFHQHLLAVRDFLGAGLSLRRTIFLGDANALIVPTPRLLPLLESVHQVYDVEALGGMFAFLDGFSGEKKSAREWAQLAELGLKRVYIGLESGSEALLKFLKKPGKPEDAIKAVQAMKNGGVAVGVIVLLGAGGQSYAREHVRDTIRVLQAMKLGMDDLLYFSELVESEGLPYVAAAYQAGLQPFTPAQRLEQGREIERALQFNWQRGSPHISPYDIRDFVY